MNKDLISFIILTYRNFNEIYETLDSLFIQNYPNIELIISDDCSANADEELDKIEGYIKEHKGSNIKNVIIRRGEKNLGTTKHINCAIKLASGEYIKSIGAGDMLYDENTLSKYKDILDESQCLICCAKVVGIADDGREKYELASCEDDYKLLNSLTPEQLREKLFWRNCLPAPAFFMKKELFEKHGYYLEKARLIEDYPYWLHLCSQGVRIAFSEERLIKYHLVGMSSAGHYSRAFLEDMLIIMKEYIYPYDKRYGIFQPVYNRLKYDGIMAYMAIDEWPNMTFGKKLYSAIRYGMFLAYIKLGEMKYK